LEDFPDFKLAARNLTGALHGIVDWFNKENDYKNQFPYQIMSPKFEESVALSYAIRLLIHYVGDVHQPLHCVSRVNNEYPAGDRGGNSFPLPTHYSTKELHAVWDSAVYEFKANDKLVSDVISYI
jgi:hypothetical protein